MPDLLSMLAEARIREWQEQVRRGEVAPPPPPLPLESWEGQMFAEVVRLLRRAKALPAGAERDAVRAEAEKQRLHLMVAVERDRPRLAGTLAAAITAAVRED